MASFTGTSSNDNFTGTADADTFDMTQGGDDIVAGGDGNDTVNFGSAFTAADSVDGGAGFDSLEIGGMNYTGANAIVFGAATMVNVERVFTDPGFDYDLTLNAASLVAGQSLTIGNQAPTNTGSLTIDASQITQGSLTILGSQGFNDLTGTSGLSSTEFDFDLVPFTADDRIDGGSGYAILEIEGDYSAGLFMQATTMVNVGQFVVGGAYVYDITTDDANVSAGRTLAINASNILAGGGFIFDGSAETDGSFYIACGLGINIIDGGAQGDTFDFEYTTMTAAARVNGGGGTDVLALAGNYANLVFQARTMTNVEYLDLLSGHINLTLANANVAAGKALFIISNPMGTGNSASVDASADNDGIIQYGGGAGADSFTTTLANFTRGGNFNGGSGSAIDVLGLKSGVASTTDLTLYISHVEQIVLANAGNHLTFGDALVNQSDLAGQLTIVGGTGNDVVDARTVATLTDTLTIVAGSGSDTLRGGAEADIFKFAANALDASDVVSGGTSTATDQLVFTTAGTIAAAALAGVAHIEQITLASGSNSLSIPDALVTSTDDKRLLTIIGSNGNDTVDGSGVVTATNKLVIIAGSGNDTLTGGAGADSFLFDGSALDLHDTVNGGGGSKDAIIFTSATTPSTNLVNVSHVEEVHLSNSNNVLSLKDGIVGSADGGVFTLYGGSGADIISAGAVVLAADAIVFVSGSGSDNLTGGAGADVFQFAAADLTNGDTVNGGSGAAIDTLEITNAGTLAATALSHVTHVERIVLDGTGAHALTITTGVALTADDGGILTVVGNAGADTITAASSVGGSIVFDGAGGADILTGSLAADTFLYAAVSESTGNAGGTAYDTIAGFSTSADRIDLPAGIVIGGSITTISGSPVSSASFNTDMATAIGSALGASQAVLVHATGGSLNGHEFLVVNPTGTAGYVSGADYVFDVTGHSGSFTVSDFI